MVVARCAGALVVWMMHTTSRCTAAASVLATNDTVDLLLQSRSFEGCSCTCRRSRDYAFVCNYAPLLSRTAVQSLHSCLCRVLLGSFAMVERRQEKVERRECMCILLQASANVDEVQDDRVKW